jgi:hypothetical protein
MLRSLPNAKRPLPAFVESEISFQTASQPATAACDQQANCAASLG